MHAERSSVAIRPIAKMDVQPLDAAYPEPGRPTSRHRERWNLRERDEGCMSSPGEEVISCAQGARSAGWVDEVSPAVSFPGGDIRRRGIHLLRPSGRLL
jgi:hypothetical protein